MLCSVREQKYGIPVSKKRRAELWDSRMRKKNPNLVNGYEIKIYNAGGGTSFHEVPKVSTSKYDNETKFLQMKVFHCPQKLHFVKDLRMPGDFHNPFWARDHSRPVTKTKANTNVSHQHQHYDPNRGEYEQYDEKESVESDENDEKEPDGDHYSHSHSKGFNKRNSPTQHTSPVYD